MTETTAATASTPEDTGSARSAARCRASRCGSPTDGEILLGREHLPRVLEEPRRDAGAIATAGCTPATSASSTRTATSKITGRKKDIIITAGGKNLTPANLENDLKQSRWISQAVMHGDRRPYPVALVTLDEEEIVPWAQQQGIEDTSIAALAATPRSRADPGGSSTRRTRSTPSSQC